MKLVLALLLAACGSAFGQSQQFDHGNLTCTFQFLLNKAVTMGGGATPISIFIEGEAVGPDTVDIMANYIFNDTAYLKNNQRNFNDYLFVPSDSNQAQPTLVTVDRLIAGSPFVLEKLELFKTKKDDFDVTEIKGNDRIAKGKFLGDPADFFVGAKPKKEKEVKDAIKDGKDKKQKKDKKDK